MYRPPAWLRVVIVAVIAGGAGYLLLARPVSLDAAALSDAIAAYGATWPLFIAVHVVASLVFVPRTVLAIAAGALFGFWCGLAISLAGALGGAAAGFLIARYINGGLLVAEEMPRVGPWLLRAEAGGWKTVFATRLIPVLPHTLVNYAFGLTRLPLGAFLFGSLAGFLPIQIVCAELGDSGRMSLAGTGDWLAPLASGLAFLALAIAVPHAVKRIVADRRFGTFFGFARGAGAMPTDVRPEAALSDALRRVSEGPPEQDVKVGEVLVDLGARAHLLALILLAAPNLTPGPSLPGFSTILGLPLCLVAAQVMLGRPRLWLPRRLTEITVARGRLAALLGRAIPVLQRIERLMRQRWPTLVSDRAIRVLGVACLALGVILCLPIPLFTMAPALAILLIALGAISHDGAAVALGLAAGVGSFAALAVLVWVTVATVT
jgi:uncharacterized membrane protein YdjX (TVP38/TMEM64 family)